MAQRKSRFGAKTEFRLGGRANRQGEYRVEVAVPLEALGLAGVGRLDLTGDFGVVYGDAEGTTNIFRNYWSNQATGLVNDVPGEIMLTPTLWGAITFEEGNQ